jgi:hypothetical protein
MPRAPKPVAALSRPCLPAAAIAAALALCPPGARAQGADAESELEALLNTQVEGASRFLEHALDAPAAAPACRPRCRG